VADWRKPLILGDRCAICPRCGFGQRYLDGVTSPRDEPCPDCGELLVTHCQSCGAAVESIMQVDCRACGTPLRPATAFGGAIRRKAEPRRPSVEPVAEVLGEADRDA
jgi:predicted amidophosphoribosyltransferase